MTERERGFTNLPAKEVERRRLASIEALKDQERAEFQRWYQEECDRFYWRHGRCCAGCDHWASEKGWLGQCMSAPPVFGSRCCKESRYHLLHLHAAAGAALHNAGSCLRCVPGRVRLERARRGLSQAHRSGQVTEREQERAAMTDTLRAEKAARKALEDRHGILLGDEETFLARAVLEAVREPSEHAMDCGGAFQIFKGDRISPDDLDSAKRAWRAMMKAALSE